MEYPLLINVYCADMQIDAEHEFTVEYSIYGGSKGEIVDGLQVSPDEDPEIEIESIVPSTTNPSTLDMLLAKVAYESNHDQLIDKIWDSLEEY